MSVPVALVSQVSHYQTNWGRALPTDELMEELCRRFDASIFCGCNNGEGPRVVTRRYFHGPSVTLLGRGVLIERALYEQSELIEMEEEDDPQQDLD